MTEETIPTSISFDYIKGNLFRVIHADGAFLGLTGQGGLTITFFSERQPIPRRVVHEVSPDGAIGHELRDQRVVRDAVVREADVCVAMNIDTARRLLEIVSKMIESYDSLAAENSKSK